MSEEIGREDMGGAAERARDAVRSLGAAPADPAYRARLREAFTTGAFEPVRGRVVPIAPPRRTWLRLMAPLAAAAALIAVLVLNQPPRWRLESATGQGVAVVDGRAVPMNHVEELARRVRPGARIQVPADGTLELMLPGQMLVQLTPGTEFIVPDAPGRWFDRSARAELVTGEARLTTGAAFRGARLAIQTPEAEVQVTGTTLAVIVEPAGTCVCVLDGTVRMGPGPHDMLLVPSGGRRYVFRDGRRPELAEIRKVEAVELVIFRSRMAEVR